MAEVVVAEFMDDGGLGLLSATFDTFSDPELWRDRPRLMAAAADARALVVRNKTEVDASLIAAAPRLEVIGRLGVGLDNIDLEACREAGVEVRPARGVNATAVAEYVIGATVALTRKAFFGTHRVVAGEWPRTEMVGHEVAGRTLGLVGLGDIALEVARKAAALGMHVVAFDPLLEPDDPAWQHAERCQSLLDLLGTSDVVSLHVPLTSETSNLLDAGTIAAMKERAIVINTSRGGVVDERALAEALRTGRLGGAALDVFVIEPLDAEAASTFAGIPNIILTPHVAGVTAESNVAVSRVVAERVIEVLGSPRSDARRSG